MEGIGIDVRANTALIGFETGSNHRIRSVLTADGSIPADVVVLGLGVRPNTALAREPACRWAITVACERTYRCRLWATTTSGPGGDCVEVLNLVSGFTASTAARVSHQDWHT